jgi:hypothetical protein
MADQLLAGIPPVFASNGEVVAGGTVTFYQTGTDTLVEIWSDQAGMTALTNPITLDAWGRAPQVFYTGSVAVREVINSAAGVQIDDIDPSPRFSVTASGADGITFSPIGSNPAENVQDAIENVSTALASFADTPVATVGGGTSDAISLTSGKSLTSVATGQKLSFIAALSNTGAMTVAVDGLPAKAIKTITGFATPANYVRAGVLTDMFYDGTQWIASRIVEVITNANGTAYRLEDGRMECSLRNLSLSTLSAGNTSIAAVWTYPSTFSAAPVVMVTGQGGGASAVGSNVMAGPFAATQTTTNVGIFARSNPGSSYTAGNSILADVTATGRWYA